MEKYYQLKISTSNFASLIVVKKLLSTFCASIKVVILPKKKKRFTLIRSPHVNKKSKEHFQILKYQRLFYVTLTEETLRKFLVGIPNDLEVSVKKNT
jgi:small subunit ribosomal protein S10|tara:strand:+ start:1320 stop:1610 length:291 start_codon:yes stop_codon:yes gene_type:complete